MVLQFYFKNILKKAWIRYSDVAMDGKVQVVSRKGGKCFQEVQLLQLSYEDDQHSARFTHDLQCPLNSGMCQIIPFIFNGYVCFLLAVASAGTFDLWWIFVIIAVILLLLILLLCCCLCIQVWSLPITHIFSCHTCNINILNNYYYSKQNVYSIDL